MQYRLQEHLANQFNKSNVLIAVSINISICLFLFIDLYIYPFINMCTNLPIHPNANLSISSLFLQSSTSFLSILTFSNSEKEGRQGAGGPQSHAEVVQGGW